MERETQEEIIEYEQEPEMIEIAEIEEDYSDSTMFYRKKLQRKLLIVFISTLLILFTRAFPLYSDFDVIMHSDLFLALFTLTIVLSITLYLFLQKTRNNLKSLETNKFHKRFLDLYDLFSIVPIFIAIMTVLNAFVISPASVIGESMEPTFYEGDDVIIEHFDSNYELFDVVIIKVDDGDYYIKRVIGLPGDIIIIDNNIITVNGRILNQEFIENEDGSMISTTYCNSNQELVCEFDVPEGYYFVLGDNREHSLDSRSSSLGYVSADRVYGKVIYKFNNVLRNILK